MKEKQFLSLCKRKEKEKKGKNFPVQSSNTGNGEKGHTAY